MRWNLKKQQQSHQLDMSPTFWPRGQDQYETKINEARQLHLIQERHSEVHWPYREILQFYSTAGTKFCPVFCLLLCRVNTHCERDPEEAVALCCASRQSLLELSNDVKFLGVFPVVPWWWTKKEGSEQKSQHWPQYNFLFELRGQVLHTPRSSRANAVTATLSFWKHKYCSEIALDVMFTWSLYFLHISGQFFKYFPAHSSISMTCNMKASSWTCSFVFQWNVLMAARTLALKRSPLSLLNKSISGVKEGSDHILYRPG